MSFDWRQTLYSQYANSPTFLALLDNTLSSLDQEGMIDDWYDKVWNLDTAIGYGLDVWGRIVGIGRVIPGVPGKFLGFEEATTASADPWDQSPWYAGTGLTSNVVLGDPAYRKLIYAKAASNLWDGSTPGLNAILRMLYAGQLVYVTTSTLALEYVFGFEPSAVEYAIAANTNVLPRPAGIETTFTIL